MSIYHFPPSEGLPNGNKTKGGGSQANRGILDTISPLKLMETPFPVHLSWIYFHPTSHKERKSSS
jgi:hypothetical protein